MTHDLLIGVAIGAAVVLVVRLAAYARGWR